MKIIFIMPLLLLSTKAAMTQDNTNSTTAGMGQELMEMSKFGARGTGYETFQTYSSTLVKGSQFFFPVWKPGEVVTTHLETFSEGLQFCYDKVRQELFIKKKDSSLILLGNKDEIQSFSLKDGDQSFHFVNSKLFTDQRPQVFYQVLVYDSSKLSLFKYIKTTLVKADVTDMMKQAEGDIYDAFVDKDSYYLVNNHSIPEPVLLKSKSLKKAFADLNVNPEKYLDDHPGAIDEAYLTEMVKYLNR